MPKRQRKSKRFTRIGRRAVLFLVAVLVASWLPVLILRFVPPPTTSFMLQHSASGGEVAYAWVDWPRIDPNLGLAVVAAEDQKFPRHFGFDFESIGNALEDSQAGEPLRGASTITQQVAKNLFLWSGRSWVRKGLEAYFALLIEATWSKQRILEVYLNVAEFGRGIYGAGSASMYYFGKPAAELSAAQAALLASVLPNPKGLHVDRPSAYVRERQRWILSQMQRLRRAQALASIR